MLLHPSNSPEQHDMANPDASGGRLLSLAQTLAAVLLVKVGSHAVGPPRAGPVAAGRQGASTEGQNPESMKGKAHKYAFFAA